jgi:hypothetical protein
MHHSTFLYILQWHAAQQNTHKGLFCFELQMVTPVRHIITSETHCLFLWYPFINMSQWWHYLREQRNTYFYDYFENSGLLYVILEIDNFITCGLKLFYVSGTRVIMKVLRFISRTQNNLLSLPIYQVLNTTLLHVMDTLPQITALKFQLK